MILSCPACATRYTIDEAQLGPSGRTVRCAACRNTWHAERPAGEPIELPLTSPVPDKVEDLQAVKAEKLPLKYRAMVEDQKRIKALAAQGMIWGALGAAVVAVLALAFFLRVDIVRAFPRVAGAYAMVDLRTYGTNLRFGSYTAASGFKDGRFIVTVNAQVRNATSQPVPVPPVRVALLDSRLQQFDSVVMPSGGLVVPAHATRTLTFDVPDPKNLTSSVDLLLDVAAMKSAPATAKPALQVAAQAPARAPAALPAPASEDDTAPADASAGTDSDAGPAYADADAGATTDAASPVSSLPKPALRPALSTSDSDSYGQPAATKTGRP